MVQPLAPRFDNLRPGRRFARQLHGRSVPHGHDVGSHRRLDARGTQDSLAHWSAGNECVLSGIRILDDVLAGAAVSDTWWCDEW